MKRFLALVLAMSLTLSLVPVTTLAEETAPEETVSYDVPAEAPETDAPATEPSVETTVPTTEETQPPETTEEASSTDPTLAPLSEEEGVLASGTFGADGAVLTWVLTEDGTLTISGSGAMNRYSAPTAPWYSNRTKILSVIVEPGVTSIGNYAFYGCLKLASVTLPEAGLQFIGNYAFQDCTKLAAIDIPQSVTDIGYSAFRNCTSLKSVTIPEGVTEIEGATFWDCTRLASVDIPESVTSIGHSAFNGCASLTNVEIPKDVTEIYDSAFNGCASLGSVTIPAGVARLANSTFEGCANLKSVVISEGVASIGRNVFEDCHSLTNVAIPGSVTSIDVSAFENCTDLVSVTIPEGVTSIGYSAFESCTSLTDITIPEGVTHIGSRTFFNCTSLKNVVIPKDVSRIDEAAFESCNNLAGITIPEGVTSISDRTFLNCTSLKNVVIPEGVTSIGLVAFENCTSLTSVTIPESLVSIDNAAFFGCEKLAHVYYGGSDLQWKDIQIESDNTSLTGAVIHYNSVHTHNPERIPGKAATCTVAGNREYWHCFDCDEYFADADCTQVIREADMVLPALGHDMTKVEAVVPTYTATGNNEYYTCSRCGRAFKDEQGETETTVEAETLAKLDKGTEIRPVATSALISGSKLTLTAWTLPDNKKAKVKWSLSEDSEAYASISSSGVLTAKNVNEVQNITVIATPTDGSPEARKEIQILPKITVKQVEKFNLFHSYSRVELAITGGTVDYALLDGNKDFVLENENDHFYIRFADPENPPAKPNTRATLQVFFPGSDTPATKALTISTTNTAPKLKLNPTSSILNTTLVGGLTVEAEVLGTEDESLEARSATSGVTASIKSGKLVVTLDNAKTTTATIYLKGNDWAKEVKLPHRIIVTEKKPTVKFTAKGKLDVLNPASEIVYTPKLSNATGTITDVRLEGQDANLFNAEVVDGLVHLTMKADCKYATKKTYKVMPIVTLLGKDITGPTLSVKVTQSAMKLAKIPNQTVSKSSPEDLTVNIKIISPANAKIGDVRLNAKTTAALRKALDAADGIQAGGGAVTFPASTFASLKPGRYTVILDVFPANAASDTKPIQAKFTLTVQK